MQIQFYHSHHRMNSFQAAKLRESDDEVYGEKMSECNGSSDEGTGFKGVVWHEEYGFVKVIFRCWCTIDTETVRLYFDRELYQKRRKRCITVNNHSLNIRLWQYISVAFLYFLQSIIGEAVFQEAESTVCINIIYNYNT